MGEETVPGVAALNPSSYDATADNGLAGFRQFDGLQTAAGRAGTGTGIHDRYVKVRVVG